ncbi:DUF885 family protein [Polymorphobacter multimanifer]|uniref:DUF885 family protein n=1 Tax=Polymorphobacter multimanifer TaxID=1070431 RepID=A0A841L9W8_9SPHN|nr:DUF885 family protein [Polymorphobacter multimanifer]MBB6227763.1 hypothetical protein [Polymorphobacter multimanifer]
MIMRIRGTILATTLALLLASPASAGEPAGRGNHTDLVALFGEYQAWKAGIGTEHTPQAVAARLETLGALRARLNRIGVQGWPRHQKADWLVVRSRLDEAEFVHKITRPWARDPGFVLEPIQRLAFTTLPGDPAFAAKLRGVPTTLANARATLDDVAADHADLALRSLVQSDGVEDGYPYRADPPRGVIGWYKDLQGRAAKEAPALVPDIEKAIAALEDYRRWLASERPRMQGRAGVGTEALDWYLRHVLLMPYTSQDAATLSQRELDRLWGFYALERHRNRALPEIKLAASDAEYMARVEATDARVRRFLVEEDFISIPDMIPADWRKLIVPGTYSEPINVPFITRATPPNYWEQIQFRDPSPDHLHAVIPGHRFDLLISNANPNPIRAGVVDGARWQGWAVYLEEAALQAGFFDDQPRQRELIQLFGLWRAARALGDVWNQRNEKTAAEVSAYWLKVTPLLDADVARKYAHIRTLPGHGLEYTIGNVQMWNLLSERRQQLGDKFELKAFHDDFIRRGRIPMSLIRYEMTGNDSDLPWLFDDTPMPAVK